MKTYSLLLFILGLTSLSAQTVISERVANLNPENYTIEGNATLRTYDNGTLELSLSDDFDTPQGPDVRIFLGTSLSLTDAVELVDLSSINHFSGAYNVNVPAGIDIEDYDYVLFFCVAFQQFWASGQFGETTFPGGGFECLPSGTAAAGELAFTSVCPTEAEAPVTFTNSINAAGENYAYLITDENDALQHVVTTNSFDFAGSGSATQRVYGISYSGELNVPIGANRLQATAAECIQHSSATEFLTVLKNGCDSYECRDQATATTDWVSTVDICPNDVIDDILELRNSLSIAPGDHYAYLLTSEDETLLEVIYDTFYNFSNTGSATLLVYGINYDGELIPQIGANRLQTTATGCFTHSSADLFLTVTKNGCANFECEESLTATRNWVTNVDLCTTDGEDDNILIQNNINTPPGENYVFLLTDTNEVLLEIISDSIYNFEGRGTEEMRIYGLSYAGELAPAIGENRANTTASDCHIHSGGNLFLTIQPTASCASATFDAELATRVNAYPVPTSDLLNISFPSGFAPQYLRVTDLNGRVVLQKNIATTNSLQLNVSQLVVGTYFLQLWDEKRAVSKRISIVR